MPRNGSGVMFKPAGTTAVPNTKVESAKYNATIDDLVADLNAARPITAGGTGATSAAGARAALGVAEATHTHTATDLRLGAWTNVASAATVDLGAQASRNLVITGTTTITSFGTAGTVDGVEYRLRFAGVLTLTHGASLILPGAANIATAAGDVATVVHDGANVWRVISYDPAAGLLTALGTAATLNVGIGAGQIPQLSTGTTGAGTYARSGTTVTVTRTAHGLTTGQFATLDFTTGTATDGTYAVTVTDANTFTVTDTVSGTTSGNVAVSGPVRLPAVDGSQLTGLAVPVAAALNASGSAPIYASRAWGRFNGNVSVSSLTSGNVSGVVRNSAGNYTVTFGTALPDANYGVVLVGKRATLSEPVIGFLSARSTTSFTFVVGTGSFTPTDGDDISFVVVR
jgi:hypothetical protein